MKKNIGIFLCFVVIILFSSCGKNADTKNSSSDKPGKVVSEKDDADKDNMENEDSGSEDLKNKESSNKTESNSSDSKTDSEKNESQDITKNNSIQNSDKDSSQNKTPTGSQNINSSVEGKIEENLPNVVGGNNSDDNAIGDAELVLGEDYGAYLYEGTFVNLAVDNNTVYSVFKAPNVIVAYDAENLEVIYSKPLVGRPAEIQVEGSKLLISFPDIHSIKVYNKATFREEKSISLQCEVSSFCIDGDIIYYSEDDQWCAVYRTNLATKETISILSNYNVSNLFYYPKLLLNKERGLLYVGESHLTGSALYYYHASDLSLHSIYKKDNYGITNYKRTMFLVNDNVFWGGLRFGTDSAKNILGMYGSTTTCYADQNFVITKNSIYDTNSYQHIGDVEGTVYMAVTANQCLIAVFQYHPGNVVVAIPY